MVRNWEGAGGKNVKGVCFFFFFSCARPSLLHLALSSCHEQGLLFIVVQDFTVVPSNTPNAFRLQYLHMGSAVVALLLSTCEVFQARDQLVFLALENS